MTKNEKKILKYCNKNFREKFNITTHDLSPYLDLSNEEIYTCCKHLYEEKYITRFRPAASHFVNFQLDHNGKHYREIHRQDVTSFLLRSILTPIIVSIVTTLITLLLA